MASSSTQRMGGGIAKTITTRSGTRMDDNYLNAPKKEVLAETLEQNDVDDIEDVAFLDGYNRKIKKDGTIGTITTRVDASNNNYLVVKGNYGNGHHAKNVYGTDGVSPTITTGNHGLGTSILVKNATNKGYLEAEEGDGVDISTRMDSHRGTVQKKSCQTITTMGGANVGVVVNVKNKK